MRVFTLRVATCAAVSGVGALRTSVAELVFVDLASSEGDRRKAHRAQTLTREGEVAVGRDHPFRLLLAELSVALAVRDALLERTRANRDLALAEQRVAIARLHAHELEALRAEHQRELEAERATHRRALHTQRALLLAHGGCDEHAADKAVHARPCTQTRATRRRAGCSR
ncbi:hypothetical protein KFE25_008447 [Diacronema lutheri]|uniref:Uncharacterized protein n=1 Tax=Diacronema lutheri TaxID=2081491 RepID=A0A8J5XD78_DIALT|nr:hypothetical protein KFE25_008447 [Diacronema lutheri]